MKRLEVERESRVAISKVEVARMEESHEVALSRVKEDCTRALAAATSDRQKAEAEVRLAMMPKEI